MTSKTWRQHWLEPLARLLRGETSGRGRRARVVLALEILESRLVPSASVQFTTGSESVNESAGTFSIPVTLTGTPTFTTSTFVTGVNSPFGLAFDAAGNLYVADPGAGTVSKVTPAGVVSTFASGFHGPFGLAFDAAGNLYVTNDFAGTVSEVTPAGVVSAFASGFSTPEGLAFDAAGNLYVANFGGTTVSKVTPAGVVSTFASEFKAPVGLAFDAAGNLYVADAAARTVSEVTPAGVVSAFASGFSDPQCLAFDAAGNLYVVNLSANTVSKVTPAGVVSTFASGFSNPVGLAIDAAGNLYVASYGDSTVKEISTAVTVPFTLGGTAVSGVDYSGDSTSPLVFAPGQTTVDVTGTLLPDPGGVQTLTFTLGTPSSNAVLGSPAANTLTITEPNPAPILTSISPTSATAGSPDTVVTLTGTGFINGSTADFNGTPISTVFVSATSLTALIPASDLTTAGIDSITVVTAGPGGGTSAAQTFTVNNPAPILTSISPTSATVGDPDTTITLTGKGFVHGSTADFNGTPLATTFVSATQLTAVVPASDLTTAGMDSITVVTAGPGGGESAAQTFTVNEALTPNQRFLSHVYLDLLHRPIDASGLASWGAMLDAGANRISLVLAIENDPGHEFLHGEVNDAFLQYLHRDADASGLTSFSNFLAGGGTVEQMDALIASSPEYLTDAASRGGFNNAFYEDALGRPLGAPTDPPASPPLTPAQITAVFTSPEYYLHLASEYYLRFLDRRFGAGDSVRAGTPDGIEEAEIIGDPGGEYFNKTAP